MRLSKNKKSKNNIYKRVYVGLFIQQIVIICYLAVTTLIGRSLDKADKTLAPAYSLWCAHQGLQKKYFLLEESFLKDFIF